MAKKVETSVEEKLRALFDLQLIDSRIDQIRSIRGELPLEVEDLENEKVKVSLGGQDQFKAGDIQKFISGFQVLNSDLVILLQLHCFF